MDDIPGWLIVLIILVLVIAINFSLAWNAIKTRGRTNGIFAAKGIREIVDPWLEEDIAMDDLHRRVEDLARSKRPSAGADENG
jgi:hypothetical protein